MKKEHDQRAGHEETERFFEVILDSISEGVFTVDLDWRITNLNRAAEEMTGAQRERARGMLCRNVLQANICDKSCALRYTLETGCRVTNFPIKVRDVHGIERPVSISTALLKDRNGRCIGGVETLRDLSVVEGLRREIKGSFSFHDMISKNPRMRELFDILPGIAESDATVLIDGPSGTGKGMLARAIHTLSRRARHRMVTVNCGAIPETLLESELFGYKAGAFTGARRDKPGKLAYAEGGTILLDEIADLPRSLQVKLLRVIEDKTYEPLGSVSPRLADVRYIAATNRDLEHAVQAGDFREDLFYRLNVIHLELPPLSARKEDIPLLIDHFLTKNCSRLGKNIDGVSPIFLGILMNHDFPGNIRELENIVEHACVLCQEPKLGAEHLPTRFRATHLGHGRTLRNTIEQIEAELIRQALQDHDWNREATARALGIHRATLFKKMRQFDIIPTAPNTRYPT